MERIRAYYNLTKPGIIKGNLLVAAAGYVYGAQNHIDIPTFIGLLVGTSAIIAAGCVVNNYYDRHIDRAMKRTHKRALVTGEITGRQALVFASLLGIVGVLALILLVNITVLVVGIIGFATYAIVYTVAKHKTVHATLIGTLPGATPPVAGYAAATGRIDTAAILLFLVMVAWQMAHFYAISLFRMTEYKAAMVPVFAVVKGEATTRKHIQLYILAFAVVAPLLTVLGYASLTYGVVMGLVGLYWLYLALQPAEDYEKWAKKIFGFSLLILLIFSGLLAVNSYLP